MRVAEAVREEWRLDVHQKVPRDGSDQKGDDAEGSDAFADKMRAKILSEQ